MLLRNQSNKINLFKYFLLIPVVSTLFWGISCDNKGDTLFNNGEEDWGEKVVNSLSDDSASKEAIAFMSDGNEGQTYIMNVKNKETHTMPDKGPEFKGAESLQEYLNKNIKYPEEAKVNNISGIVYVYFEINKKGAVQNARILRGIRDSFDDEVLNAVKSMPDWEPAYFMDQPLVIQMVMPVSFSKKATEFDAEKFRQKAGFPDDHSGKDKPFVVAEEQPQYKGGEQARIRYLANNIEYPAEAREKGIQGRVFVNFIVEKDGSISNVRILRGIGGGCDEEALKAIENMPKWVPGKNDGKPVRTEFNMPIRFTLDSGKPAKPEKPDEVSDNSEAYVMVDERPEFKGGMEARAEYMRQHLDYPEDAKEKGLEGTVYVQFVVEKDGSISGLRLLRGFYESCDQEALETIRNMADWEPGMKDGEAVRTQVNLPIKFALDK